MGYFADNPTETRRKFFEEMEKKAQFHPASFGRNSGLAKIAAKVLWDFFKNSSINHDLCNTVVNTPLGKWVHRNPYCQTPPKPAGLERQLRELDLTPCGSISFSIVFCTKILGERWVPNATNTGGYIELIRVPSSIEQVMGVWRRCRPDSNASPETLFESNGGTGSIENVNLGNNIRYIRYFDIPHVINDNCRSTNPPFGSYYYPYYISSSSGISVNGRRDKMAIGIILDHLSTNTLKPEVYRIQVSNESAENCPYSKPDILPPPPPPPEKDCDCMNCCPDVSNLEALLKLIIKRIGEPEKVTIFDENLERKGTQKADKTPQSLNQYFKLSVERTEIVNRLLGIDNYPMTVPDTMITPFQDGVFGKIFKFIDGNKKRKINSVTELIAWMSEQDSAVLGEFHQVIEFESENKKTSKVVLPNVAEALKEIVLLTSQMAKQNNIQTELMFKIAAETVATRAVATKGTEIVQDIQDYLDYPTETKTKTIPSAISLPKITTNEKGQITATAKTEDPKSFLKTGQIKIVYDDWTGKNSLHDQLLDLLQLASMLRAVYYQRTDK